MAEARRSGEPWTGGSSATLRREVRIPIWGVCAVVAVIGLLMLLAFFLVNRIAGRWDPLTSFGYEVAKAMLVASTAGVFFARIMERVTKRSAVFGNIHRTYPTRQAAINRFEQLVTSRSTHTLCIAGVSQRDFLTGGGGLKPVWDMILKQLGRRGKAQSVTGGLKVRLLFLDPDSSEGRFRSAIERSDSDEAEKRGLGLRSDVYTGLATVDAERTRLCTLHHVDADCLAARLYEHCPFAFVFITETTALVQQYSYHPSNTVSQLPVIEYSHASKEYREIHESLTTVWEHAHDPTSLFDVGVARAIQYAAVRNIYAHDQRETLGHRQTEAIRATRDPNTVDIVSLTGKFYRRVLRENPPILEPVKSPRVRMALVNPVSQQAILRAVADSRPTAKVRATLAEWSWEQHEKSTLYSDIVTTVAEVEQLNMQLAAAASIAPKADRERLAKRIQPQGVELRFYSSSTACSLLLASDSIFIEPYIYGRDSQVGALGHLPVFEVEASRSVDARLLTSTFEAIWSYSIGLDEYRGRDPEAEFEANLRRLQKELSIDRAGQGVATAIQVPVEAVAAANVPSKLAG